MGNYKIKLTGFLQLMNGRCAVVGVAGGAVGVFAGERNGRRVQSILPGSMFAEDAAATGQSSD